MVTVSLDMQTWAALLRLIEDLAKMTGTEILFGLAETNKRYQHMKDHAGQQRHDVITKQIRALQAIMEASRAE